MAAFLRKEFDLRLKGVTLHHLITKYKQHLNTYYAMKKYLRLAVFAIAALSFNNANAQSVLLDSHSDAAGATTWQITTTHAHELILIGADGYGAQLSDAAGTVTVNGNNAAYITKGEWYQPSYGWTASVWAYEAATVGTYTLVCTETGLITPYYFNYATAVYDPTDSLSLSDILVGGHDSNQNMTTITTSITTTKNNSFVYGTTSWNDNPGSGTINWNGGLTELDHDYLGNGVDCAQADSTIATAGLQTITVTDIGASSPWAVITLVAVQPPAPLGVKGVNSLDKQVQIYPSPFSQSVNVTVQEPVTVTMFNMLGENVGSWKVEAGHNTINTQPYPNGVYMLQVKTEDGKLLNKEMIKVQ
jgi:hypothetical protein